MPYDGGDSMLLLGTGKFPIKKFKWYRLSSIPVSSDPFVCP